MNTDFIIGALIASCLWAIIFILFIDWNYRMIRRAFAALEGMRLGYETGQRLIGLELEKTRTERDAWKAEAQKLGHKP